MSNSREWVYTEPEVKELIRNGFSALYRTSHVSTSLHIPTASIWQARLTDEDQDILDVNVTDEEIKASLWSLKALRHLGLTGFTQASFNGFGS